MLIGAVCAFVAVFERDRGNPRSELLEFLHGRRHIFRVYEFQEGAAEQLLRAPSQGLLEGGVDALEVAVDAGDAEHVQR